jgi:hypothetical protein
MSLVILVATPCSWARRRSSSAPLCPPSRPRRRRGQAVDTVEEVVVTGQRAAIQSAQKLKQNAEQMVDSITSTDIGALPDRSVTEALQRISGVTIGRTSDRPRRRPHLGRRQRRAGSRPQLGPRRTERPRQLLGQGRPHPELRRRAARADGRRRRLQEPVGRPHRRRRRRHGQPAHAHAVRFQQAHPGLFAGFQLGRPGPEMGAERLDPLQQPLGHQYRRAGLPDRPVRLQAEQPHRHHVGRPLQRPHQPGSRQDGVRPRRLRLSQPGLRARAQGHRRRPAMAPNEQWEATLHFLRSSASQASTERANGFNPGSNNGPALGTSFTYAIPAAS